MQLIQRNSTRIQLFVCYLNKGVAADTAKFN